MGWADSGRGYRTRARSHQGIADPNIELDRMERLCLASHSGHGYWLGHALQGNLVWLLVERRQEGRAIS